MWGDICSRFRVDNGTGTNILDFKIDFNIAYRLRWKESKGLKMCEEKCTCTKVQNKVQERGETKALERRRGMSSSSKGSRVCFYFLELSFLASDVISIIIIFPFSVCMTPTAELFPTPPMSPTFTWIEFPLKTYFLFVTLTKVPNSLMNFINWNDKTLLSSEINILFNLCNLRIYT